MKTKYYTLYKLTLLSHVFKDLITKNQLREKKNDIHSPSNQENLRSNKGDYSVANKKTRVFYRQDQDENYNKIDSVLKTIINIFQNKTKLFLFCFNQEAELHLEEFFIIKSKKVLYFIVVGNMILIDDWNKKVHNLLENYIKKNSNFNGKNYFDFTDLTYWAKNSEVKPRRLRSVGGALRRILQDSKETYSAKETYSVEETAFSDIDFYAILGNIDELKTIFLAVKTNKKIPKLAELNTVVSLQKQSHIYTNEQHSNLKYRTVDFIQNFANIVYDTNLDEKKLNKIKTTLSQLQASL